MEYIGYIRYTEIVGEDFTGDSFDYYMKRYELSDRLFHIVIKDAVGSVKHDINHSEYFMEDEFSDFESTCKSKRQKFYGDPDVPGVIECDIIDIDVVYNIKFVKCNHIIMSKYGYWPDSLRRFFGRPDEYEYNVIGNIDNLEHILKIVIRSISDDKLCYAKIKMLYKWFILKYLDVLEIFIHNFYVRNIALDYIC